MAERASPSKKSAMKKLTLLSLLIPTLSLAQIQNESVSRMQDIVISASLSEQDIADAPASMTVITKEDLEKKPYRDVAEVLSQAEGVMLSGSNDRGVSLRGFSSSYTLILVDGKRLSSRSLSVRHNADADLSWIPMTDIERIEVIRGPMATIYGSDAIGGVVNIITKKVSSRWKAALAVSSKAPSNSEDTNLNQGEVFVSGPVVKDKVGLKINASSAISAMPQFPDEDPRQYTGHKDYSVSTSAVWKITPEQDLTVDFGKNFETELGRYKGSSTETKVDRTNYGLSYNLKGEAFTTQLQAYVDAYDYENSDGPAKLVNQTAKGTLQKPLAESTHFLVAGFETESNKLENKAQITSGSTSSTQVAFFAEDSMTVSEKNTLTVGARQTNHQKFGGNLSPRAYWVYKHSSSWTFKGGVGTGFKTPSLLQLEKDFTLPSCRGNCTMVGNPDLKPESSVNYELSANYGVDQWGANVTVFRSDLKEMITTYFETLGGKRYRLLRNVGDARTQGVELGSTYWLNRFLKAGVNVTYVDAMNLTDDIRLTNMPNVVANMNLDWSATEKLSFFGNVSYSGERKIESTTSTETAAPYAIFNVSGSYELPKSLLNKARLSLGIDNVMDHTLDQTYGFGEPGRMYFAKLGVEI